MMGAVHGEDAVERLHRMEGGEEKLQPCARMMGDMMRDMDPGIMEETGPGMMGPR